MSTSIQQTSGLPKPDFSDIPEEEILPSIDQDVEICVLGACLTGRTEFINKIFENSVYWISHLSEEAKEEGKRVAQKFENPNVVKNLGI